MLYLIMKASYLVKRTLGNTVILIKGGALTKMLLVEYEAWLLRRSCNLLQLMTYTFYLLCVIILIFISGPPSMHQLYTDVSVLLATIGVVRSVITL